MASLVPAIIPQNIEHLRESILRVRPFAPAIQIDIVDGIFVPFTSWPYTESSDVGLLHELTLGIDTEVDLMVHNPEELIDTYTLAGVSAIVVHLEAVSDVDFILRHRDTHGYRLGFSINNDTPLELLLPHIPKLDYVQCMGIAHIGSQGQPFDTRVLERIATLREHYPNLTISIDGSVNSETLPLLYTAGANRFVSGSALLHAENPEATYRALTALIV